MRRHSAHRELMVFALAYVTYFGVRALTEGRAATAFENARGLVDFENRIGVDFEDGIQQLVLRSHLLTDVANTVYIYGHWPVLIVSGVLLFKFRHPQYRILRDACLISGLVGLFIFATYPVAPPRLAELPLIDTVTQRSPGYRVLFPHGLVNEYAAMPSFHAGWNLLAGIAVFQATLNWALRVFALVMPAAMAFAVIATANHFILDVVAGVAIVLVALALAHRLERRRGVNTLTSGDRPQHADASSGISVADSPQSGQRSAAPARR